MQQALGKFIGNFTSFQSREGKTQFPHCLHADSKPIRRNPIFSPCYKISKGAISPARAKKIITVIVIQPYIKHFTRKCYWIVYFCVASYTAVSISPLSNTDCDISPCF